MIGRPSRPGAFPMEGAGPALFPGRREQFVSVVFDLMLPGSTRSRETRRPGLAGPGLRGIDGGVECGCTSSY